MDWYICDSNDSSSILEEHVRTSILFRKYLFVQSVAQWVSVASRWSYIRGIERTRKRKSLFYFCFISALFKNWRCVNAIFQLQSCSVKFTLFNYIFEHCEFQGYAWYLFRHSLFFHLDHIILQNFLKLKYLKHAMTNCSFFQIVQRTACCTYLSNEILQSIVPVIFVYFEKTISNFIYIFLSTL